LAAENARKHEIRLSGAVVNKALRATGIASLYDGLLTFPAIVWRCSQLFSERAVSLPQGVITLIFLESASQRCPKSWCVRRQGTAAAGFFLASRPNRPTFESCSTKRKEGDPMSNEISVFVAGLEVVMKAGQPSL
jgi:hypothetical protein